MFSNLADVSRVRRQLVGLIVGLVVLAGSPAAGQGTATIVGQVTDQSGAVLPGVTVTATSPALQVPQVTDVTNELGEYRLAPLPIGVYRGRVRSVGLSAGPAPECAADRRLHRENRCVAGSGHRGRDGHRARRGAGGGRRVDLGNHAVHARDARGHSHGPKRADQPVEPGAGRAQLSRYRRQHDRGEPAGSRVRPERPGVVHDRRRLDDPPERGRGQRQLLRLRNDRRGAGPEPRHRCGVPVARRADEPPS